MNYTASNGAAPARVVDHPLKNAEFRSLWIGSTISLFGDQCYFVALPWLVLLLTSSGVALGTILMIASVPRAVLMLVGGAAIDRFSPRRVLIWTATGRMILVAIIAILVQFHLAHVWHFYLLAFAFGTADAFSFPAGFVIRLWGVASAFFVDAVSFIFVIMALWRLPAPPSRPRGAGSGTWTAILEGLRYVVKDPPLRSLLLLITTLNLALAVLWLWGWWSWPNSVFRLPRPAAARFTGTCWSVCETCRV